MKILQIISITLTLVTSLVFGQLGFTVDAQSGYASNIFANYQQLPDYYQFYQGFLNYDKISETQGVRFFYQGSATLFEKYDYRSYSVHKAGLVYYNNVKGSNDKINAGIDVNTRLHRENYNWYEYKQGYAFANFKTMLRPQLLGYVGVNFRVRGYDNLSPYSYRQSVGFLRLSKFFNTGTSIIGEVDVMQKVYLHKDAEPTDTFAALQTDGDGQSRQFVGMLRVGQAMTAKTGLSAQALVRRNSKSSVRYLVTDEGFYYSDEELFDDPFGYNAEQFDLSIKQKLPWNMQLSLGSTLLLKHYSTRLALDMEGFPYEDSRLRDDKRIINWLSLSKSWKYSSSMSPVRFTIDVSNIQNDSNDPYYTFKTTYFTIGLSQDF